jgi:hypothetical protein
MIKNRGGAMYYGSPEHAAESTKGRHAEIKDGLQWLTFSHLPEKLRKFSAPFFGAALEMIETIPTDSPELKTAINRLIEAKDSAVRAGIRHDTGRAGSVPRPQEVVLPPSLTGVPDAPVATELGCQHPNCTLDHPHDGPAILSTDNGPACTCNHNGMSGGHAGSCPLAVF